MAPSPRSAAARQLLTALTSTSRTSIDWNKAIAILGTSWLDAQRLASLTWWTCQSVEFSADIQRELRRAYYAAAGDAELHRRELAHVLHQLNSRQIQTVVFKGAALAYGIYRDPACRTMGDIDLWVAGEDIERARQALGELGYESFRKPDRPPALLALFQGEIGLQHNYSAYGLVELHWGVFAGVWLRRTATIDAAAMRRRAVPTRLAGEAAYILAPEDALLQSALHTTVNHQVSMSALRALVDVAMLARHYSIDWTIIVQRARGDGGVAGVEPGCRFGGAGRSG